VEIEGGKVRLGFQADAAVRIHRLEVWQRMQNNVELNAPKPGTTPPDAASQAE
jgi:sRNA-binding carbon storage regulator CsrA